jgi:hypothetical protein
VACRESLGLLDGVARLGDRVNIFEAYKIVLVDLFLACGILTVAFSLMITIPEKYDPRIFKVFHLWASCWILYFMTKALL